MILRGEVKLRRRRYNCTAATTGAMVGLPPAVQPVQGVRWALEREACGGRPAGWEGWVVGVEELGLGKVAGGRGGGSGWQKNNSSSSSNNTGGAPRKMGGCPSVLRGGKVGRALVDLGHTAGG